MRSMSATAFGTYEHARSLAFHSWESGIAAKTVFEAGVNLDANRISRFAGLLQDVRFRGSSVVLLNSPFRVAFASLSSDPTRRSFSRFGIVKIDNLSKDIAGGQSEGEDQCVLLFHTISRLMGSFRGRLNVERLSQAASQRFHCALAPIVQEKNARLFVCHVVVNGGDVDALGAQGLEHRL